MKRIISLVLVMFTFTAFLCACNDKKQDNSNNPKLQTIAISEITRDTNVLKSEIDSYKNMISTDELKIVIPNIDKVYTLGTNLADHQDFQSGYSQFCQLFEALYGDYKMNEDYLFYTESYTTTYENYSDYPTVKDNFDNLNSGDENYSSLFYDETWYRDMTDWNNPVSLGVGQTLEYETITFNKGKAIYLGGKKEGIYPSLQSSSAFDLYSSFECIGTYSPDSTEKFNLSDKEIAVCDAVEFYENYINSLPYSALASVQTRVVEVDVLAVSENTYGYVFLTTIEYSGLTFDYQRVSSYQPYKGYDKYNNILYAGFMLESTDVDMGTALYNTHITDKAETEVVPVETAIEKISDELSDYVEFQVNSIELVYAGISEKTSEGYIDIETPSSTVTPAWKLTLYNPNDQLYYYCYVDATDCENFRYYTTDGK